MLIGKKVSVLRRRYVNSEVPGKNGMYIDEGPAFEGVVVAVGINEADWALLIQNAEGRLIPVRVRFDCNSVTVLEE